MNKGALAENRYDSLRKISWWDQEKVSGAWIMVVGAGALGNEILKNLALVGTGNILLVDFDVIEPSNLTRSVFFSPEDIGKPKAETAARKVKQLNPDVNVYYFNGDITNGLGLGVFREMDVIISGVDNFAARIFINRCCFKTGTPWVNGGILELMGESHVYIPTKGACYECNLPSEAYQDMQRRFSCHIPEAEVPDRSLPTTPTIASIIGAIQVQEALKLLHKMKVAGGSGLVFNGTLNMTMPVQFALNPECLYHRQLKPVKRLNRTVHNTTFRDLLQIARNDTGQDSQVELDFNLIRKLTCSCKYKRKVMKRLDRISDDKLKCPVCGRQLSPDMTSIMDSSAGKLLDTTLASAGVPPWHILRVSNGSSYVYYEFYADKNNLLIHI